MVSFIALAVIEYVMAAGFSDAAANVEAEANSLSSKISGWSSADGLQGALGIQGDFPKFVSVVDQLSANVGHLSASDVNVPTVNSLSSSIVGLLNALTEKSGDFKAVSADAIVKNDIQSLQGPAVDVAASLIKAGQNEPGKISSLAPALSSYAAAFGRADEAYGVPKANFPTLPSESERVSAQQSASQTSLSVPSASTPVLLNATLGAPLLSNSTAASGGNRTLPNVAPYPVVIPPNGGLQNGTLPNVVPHTGVIPSNNGGTIAAGVGATLAGLIALLI